MNARRVVGWWVITLLSTASLAAGSDLRLVEAVQTQRKEVVRALLNERIDVNTRQPDGATALHWAAHWDDLDTATLLLQAGADANAVNEFGVMPLYLACMNGSAAMVGAFLSAGADSNAALLSGETPLMTCARTGSADAVTALLARGAHMDATERERGQTAPMWAAAEGHPEVVRVLLEHGADVHARSEVRRVLISRDPVGREVDWTERGGFTPLLFAARRGSVDVARLLLAAGADVNATAANGTSVLVVATHSGHRALAQFLLEEGADPDAAGAGYTALHVAVLTGDLDVVQALLAHGANPNAPVTSGTPVLRNGVELHLGSHLVGATSFWLAAKFAEVEIMRVLAAGGADPAVALKDGTTPLMVAAGIGWPAGGSVDRRERYLRLVRQAEIEDEHGTLAAVRLVVELGADVSATNAAGKTALDGAVALGFDTVVGFLKAQGAKLGK